MASGRAVIDRCIVHVPDLLADSDAGKDLSRRLGVRTLLVAPLLREDQAIGTITIRRSQLHPFSDKQIELLKTFADQAAIAIENTRLLAELQTRNRDLTESLEQQTATSEILRVISQSQRDVQPVFGTIAANARKLCDGTFGGVWTFDGDVLHLMATDGFTPDGIEAMRRSFPRPPEHGYSNGRAILTRSVVYIPDVRTDPEYEFLDLAQSIGFISMLSVPMLRHGRPIGTIGVSGANPAMFTQRQIGMLQTFADQAVIAIENTRLFNELETRNRDLTESLEQQTATSEILRAISQSQSDVQPVFEAIATSAQKLCEATFAVVYKFDGELVHVAAAQGVNAGIEVFRQFYPMALTRDSATTRAILTRAIAYIPDIEQDPEYRLQSLAQTVGFRSVVAVPMLRDGGPIGAISVTGAEPVMFSERQIAMLQTFADQAVIAIENTRLFNELESRNRDLSESLEQQTATSEILRVISQSQRDVQPVFEAIAANAMKLCFGSSGWVFTFDGELINVAAGYGLTPEALESSRRLHPRPPSRDDAAARAILTRAVSYVPDIREDSEYRFQSVAEAAGYLSALSVPMLRNSSPIGAVTVTGAKPAMFSERQIAMLQTFADQAVIAIENTRLFNALESRNRDLTRRWSSRRRPARSCA